MRDWDLGKLGLKQLRVFTTTSLFRPPALVRLLSPFHDLTDIYIFQWDIIMSLLWINKHDGGIFCVFVGGASLQFSGGSLSLSVVDGGVHCIVCVESFFWWVCHSGGGLALKGCWVRLWCWMDSGVWEFFMQDLEVCWQNRNGRSTCFREAW